MTDPNCIFCKIASGEIPSRTIYEDDGFRVILDISPASRGHAIILPKNHAANLYELPEGDAAGLLPVAKKVGTAMRDVLGFDGLNVLQNNGEAAGQTVYHLHIHLIPRYSGDSVHITWTPGELKEDQADRLAEELKRIIK